MSFTVARDRLAPALVRAARVARARTPIAILSTAKLTAGPDGLRVTASGLDCVLEEQIDPEPRPDWAGCVDAARLSGFINALPPGDVTITADGQRLEVRCGRAVARLPVLPAEDFPSWGQTGAEIASIEIPAAELAAVLGQVGHAMPDSIDGNARFSLDGICLHAPGIAVASDAHRLALRRLSVSLPSDTSAIVPRPACNALQSLLRGLTGSVRVRLLPTWISFACGDWIYRSKLIDGRYPEYARAVPPRLPDPVTVNRTALAEAVARVRTVPLDQKHNASFLSAHDGELMIATDDALHEGQDTVPASGASFDFFGVNGRYLAEALAALPGAETVELHFTSGGRAAWLCAAGEVHDGVVLMAMRVAPPTARHREEKLDAVPA